MKKFFLNNLTKIFLAIICVALVCTVGVFATENLRLQYLMSFVPDYRFTISLSTDGTNYQNIFDNSGQNAITANNFTIMPEVNDELKIVGNYSDLAQIVYVKITNYTLNTTLEASISSLYIYGTTADVSGISSQIALYNATSNAITIDMGTGIEADDIIIIGITISD